MPAMAGSLPTFAQANTQQQLVGVRGRGFVATEDTKPRWCHWPSTQLSSSTTLAVTSVVAAASLERHHHRSRKKANVKVTVACHVMTLRNGEEAGHVTAPAVEVPQSRCYLHTLGSTESSKLAAFRNLLPDIIARTLQMYSAWRPEVWGVDIDRPGESTDVVLLKYLRAEEQDVGSAAQRLEATLRFRAGEGISELAGAELQKHFRGHDTISGPDVDGRPIMISRYGGMDNQRVFGDLDAFVKYRLQIMEKAMAQLTFKKGAAEDLCQVHDYSGVPLLFKTSEIKAGITAMTKVFGDHYPETKGKTIFVNFPAVFATLFQTFSVFIPEKTRKKFIILSGSDHELLFQHIHAEMVPVALGGMLADTAIQYLSCPCRLVTVPARATEEIDVLQLAAPGQVRWELRVCSQEVAYQLTFHPSSSSGVEELVSASGPGQPLRASDGVVSGQYQAKEAGTLRCCFQNEGSWFRARTCICRAALLE